MQPLIAELGTLVVESQQQVPQSLSGLGKPIGKRKKWPKKAAVKKVAKKTAKKETKK
jgi:hypothetical protein